MNLKTYRAASIADALAEIKRDLGTDAVILHTRSFKHGGWFGIRARKMVEITASSGVNVVHPLAARRGAPRTPPQPSPVRDQAAGADRARRAYAAVASATANTAARDGAAVLDAPSPAPRSTGVFRSELSSDRLQEDLSAIKRLVGQVLERSRGGVQPAMPEPLFNQYLSLLEAEVAADIADDVVGAVRDELTPDELADDATVQRAVLKRLAGFISVAEDAAAPTRDKDGRPRTIALVGPTGVGKTTTIAKLAATYKLRYGRKVGLVTCDTYRIAAVDQLRTYANIINIPLKVALTPAEMTAACEALADCDAILIDTAGRSQNDTDRLDELRGLIEAANPHETHLVLAGCAGEKTMMAAAERFAVVGPKRVIFTKLDETVSFGVLVNAARRIGATLSYVTTGQEVPDHIELGKADRIARLVLGGGVDR